MMVFHQWKKTMNHFLEYLGYEFLALAAPEKSQAQWIHGQNDYHYHQGNSCDKLKTEQSSTAALPLPIPYSPWLMTVHATRTIELPPLDASSKRELIAQYHPWSFYQVDDRSTADIC
jgi:hypothetical protein